MPDKKLEKKQIEQFKDELLKIKEKIVHDIKNMFSAHSPNSPENVNETSGGHGLHMADVATDMYDREFNLNLASNDRELLTKVENALKRLEQQEFGLCVSCKQPISLARLKAIPYTEMCLKCQENMEKKS